MADDGQEDDNAAPDQSCEEPRAAELDRAVTALITAVEAALAEGGGQLALDLMKRHLNAAHLHVEIVDDTYDVDDWAAMMGRRPVRRPRPG